MADRKETRRIALVCDRGHEFMGTATYSIISLAEETNMEREILDRIYDRCPTCGSLQVRPAAPGGG